MSIAIELKMWKRKKWKFCVVKHKQKMPTRGTSCLALALTLFPFSQRMLHIFYSSTLCWGYWEWNKARGPAEREKEHDGDVLSFTTHDVRKVERFRVKIENLHDEFLKISSIFLLPAIRFDRHFSTNWKNSSKLLFSVTELLSQLSSSLLLP